MLMRNLGKDFEYKILKQYKIDVRLEHRQKKDNTIQNKKIIKFKIKIICEYKNYAENGIRTHAGESPPDLKSGALPGFAISALKK